MKHIWWVEKSSSEEPIIVNVQIINETNFIVLKSVNKDLLLTCFCAYRPHSTNPFVRQTISSSVVV